MRQLVSSQDAMISEHKHMHGSLDSGVALRSSKAPDLCQRPVGATFKQASLKAITEDGSSIWERGAPHFLDASQKKVGWLTIPSSSQNAQANLSPFVTPPHRVVVRRAMRCGVKGSSIYAAWRSLEEGQGINKQKI